MNEKGKAHRMGFTASSGTKKALDMLADEKQVSVAWIMKLLIARGLVLEGLVAEGGKIIAQREDGSQEVLFDRQHDFRPKLDLRDD